MQTVKPSSLTKASAINPRVLRGLGNLATGLGTATLYDQIAYDVPKSVGDIDKGRALNFLFNSALGGAGRHMLRTPASASAGISLIAAAPAKDLALKGMGTLKKYEGSLDSGNKARNIALATGIPLAALATYGLLRGGKNKTTINMPEDKGRIRLTLPTRDPNDVETQVDLPMSHANLSNAARWGINRDIRRKLTAENKERVYSRQKPKKKDPETGTMINLDEYREKYASVSVPSESVERLRGLEKFAFSSSIRVGGPDLGTASAPKPFKAMTPKGGNRLSSELANKQKYDAQVSRVNQEHPIPKTHVNKQPGLVSRFFGAKSNYDVAPTSYYDKTDNALAARDTGERKAYQSAYGSAGPSGVPSTATQPASAQPAPMQPLVAPRAPTNFRSADGSISATGIHQRGALPQDYNLTAERTAAGNNPQAQTQAQTQAGNRLDYPQLYQSLQSNPQAQQQFMQYAQDMQTAGREITPDMMKAMQDNVMAGRSFNQAAPVANPVANPAAPVVDTVETTADSEVPARGSSNPKTPVVDETTSRINALVSELKNIPKSTGGRGSTVYNTSVDRLNAERISKEIQAIKDQALMSSMPPDIAELYGRSPMLRSRDDNRRIEEYLNSLKHPVNAKPVV